MAEASQTHGVIVNSNSPAVLPSQNPSLQNTEAPPPTPTTTNSHLTQALTAWQTSIEFYGKVVDEQTNPVAEAQVEFRWMELPDNKGSRSTNTASDSAGLFAIKGAKGPTLSVYVSKPGYYTSRGTPNGYTYSDALGDRFHPDAQNPVVFVLRKKGPGVPLVQAKFSSTAKSAQLRHDGSAVDVNLMTGEMATTGNAQLELKLWRDDLMQGARTFDWKLQLSVQGGGILGTDSEFPFEAPESGYEPSVVIDMPATNEIWRDEITSNFYVRLSNGDYGRFNLYVLTYNGAFRIESAVNPSGSPILEPSAPQPQLPQGTRPGMTIVRPNFK
jgi:hypothetical protein